MLQIAVGIFIILHGLVHVLYAGQSWRFFEMQTEMMWPDGSWLLSRFLSKTKMRWIAGIMCIISAAGFAWAGIAMSTESGGWLQMVVGATGLSSVVFLIFWNGESSHLGDQGAVGILINILIYLALVSFKWPDIG